ncbi:MAG: hypothetical protein AAF215_07180 [Cyanobacteria bacterium P01_A01_bin.123]
MSAIKITTYQIFLDPTVKLQAFAALSSGVISNSGSKGDYLDSQSRSPSPRYAV